MSTLNPRRRYSSASRTVAPASLIPMVIEVGNASWARPRASASGTPSCFAQRSCRAISTAARAAGASGKRSPSSLHSAVSSWTPRPASHCNPGSASAAAHVSQVSPVTNRSGEALPSPAEPSPVSIRTMPLRTESTVRNAIVYGRESSKCSIQVLTRRILMGPRGVAEVTDGPAPLCTRFHGRGTREQGRTAIPAKPENVHRATTTGRPDGRGGRAIRRARPCPVRRRELPRAGSRTGRSSWFRGRATPSSRSTPRSAPRRALRRPPGG